MLSGAFLVAESVTSDYILFCDSTFPNCQPSVKRDSVRLRTMWCGWESPFSVPWLCFKRGQRISVFEKGNVEHFPFFFPSHTLPLLHFASLHCLFIVHLLCCDQVVKEQIYQACWSFNPMNTFHYFPCNRENCVHCLCINKTSREISLMLENTGQNTSLNYI